MSALDAALASIRWDQPLAVAYSGGVDSTALLAALVALRDQRRAEQLQPSMAPVRLDAGLLALHVHHGLQAAADDFVAHVEAQCRQWDVPLVVCRVDARHAKGQSPEAAARHARYQVLAEAALARGCRTVLLAQHADDQAETVLLALTRGAGIPGLAAMPGRFVRHGIAFERPLLALSRATIDAWVREHHLRPIEDPTNGDPARTRNRLRLGVMQVLRRDFPGFEARFARTAAHAAQAQRLLDELADSDLERLGCPPLLGPLQTLGSDRQANALRRWLVRDHQTQASDPQLRELIAQVAACRTRGHAIELSVGSGVVSRDGDRIVWQPASPAASI